MEIKDSGARRDFGTGAVRDIAEGKGRCDLLPLIEVGTLLNHNLVLINVGNYVRSGKEVFLYQAIFEFCEFAGQEVLSAILEVSKHYEAGAKKYAERNWEKGISLHCYIDSGVRHYLKWLRGDTDEPHDRAFVWNMLGALWTQAHKPELIDLPFKEIQK
jgi:hypothetical protein